MLPIIVGILVFGSIIYIVYVWIDERQKKTVETLKKRIEKLEKENQ